MVHSRDALIPGGDLSALIARLEAAMSREGKPRGDHMVEAFAMMSKASAASDDEFERPMADVYDTASRCIANETAMFDAVVAVASEAIAILKAKAQGEGG